MSGPSRTETTSDVTRFRGVALASLLAGLIAVVAALAFTGRDTLRGAPGPLSRSHERAQLSCQQCHTDDGPPAARCEGCHGAHPSTRGAHQILTRAGQLGCPSCHLVHSGNEGVTLLADGRAIRHGGGGEIELRSTTGYRARTETTVPLAAAGACASCHDLDSPRDPIAMCLAVGQEGLGRERPTLCFDEHQTPGGPRDAAWEATRQVVAATSSQAPRAHAFRLGPWSWLGLGGFVGLVVLGATRMRSPQTRGQGRAQAPLRAPPLLRLPVINQATCLGCHACVDTCPFDVLEIRRFVAVVARPEACCGLTLCEQRCPNGSLVMGDGTQIDGAVALDEGLQSQMTSGIYLAGDVTGLPLIRNAINQGAHALRNLAEELGHAKGAGELDVVIVGAGPAGISAALEAKSLGLRYLVLEQGTVAGSIQSFPRNKLVFDQPLNLPLIGQLWLEESSKEELLARWLRIVRSEKLAVEEGWRVARVEPEERDGFTVHAIDEGGERCEYRTQRVLLAIGKRGSPRELAVDIPESMQDRVFYSLADARSFAGQRVLVVGLGDVAMEAAIALSRQPGTRVVVSHRGDDFRRGKARNIDELRRRVAGGAIDLRMQTTVRRIEEGQVTLSSPLGDDELDCDGLFVLIGTIPPIEFLTRAGVLPSPINHASDKENET